MAERRIRESPSEILCYIPITKYRFLEHKKISTSLTNSRLATTITTCTNSQASISLNNKREPK